MRKMKNNFMRMLLITSLVMASGLPAIAAEYPTHPITLIIPFPPGGTTDLACRALTKAATRFLGQPIICENKTGGQGSVGATLVLTKPPDGYTLGTMATMSITAIWNMGKLNFNPIDDPTHIIRVAGYVYGLVVRADSQWQTIQEFIEYSKQNPQKIFYGCPGIGGVSHLIMEELASLAGGIQWTMIPYKGSPETSTALLGGHLDAASDSSGWAPLVDAGKLRLLVTYGQHRSARYPQVPTLKESGYDISYPSPLEIFGPKGMPKPIVQKLHDSFKKGMDDPEFQAVLEKLDMPLIYFNSEDCEKALRQESERIGKIVKKLGLQKKDTP